MKIHKGENHMANTSTATQLDLAQKRKSLKFRIKRDKFLLLMLIPVIVYYLIFCYRPMGGLIIAFKDYNMFKGMWASDWVGLKNFQRVFTIGDIFKVVKNTLVLNGLTLVVGFPGPIILALMLNEIRNMAFKRTVQTIVYLPYFLSWVVVVGIISPLLSPTTGIVNKAIVALGGSQIHFMGEPKWWIFTYVLMDVWKGVGWGAIIYLSALTSIDPSLYDAARIDGAGRLKQILHVSLPGIAPTITVMLIMRIGGMMGIGFDQAYLMGNDQVKGVADVISTYVYRMGVVKAEYSRTTAVGLSQSVVNIILLYSANLAAKRINGEGIF
jgi:putative aldouronate transport system permease protein